MKTIVYIRKSTDVEDKQVYSLEAQERILLELAKKQNLKIIKIFKESVSAKSTGRKGFEEMKKYINKYNIDVLLTWKLDRLARNFIDGGYIIDSLQTGKIKEIKTPHKTYYQNEPVYLMSMEFGVSNQYIRDLSINVKRGNEQKLLSGGWPNKAPFGYKNDLSTKTVIFDKKTYRYVKRMFELYTHEQKSLKEISDILFYEGLRNGNGNKVFKSTIGKVLRNSFYYGMMLSGGKLYIGNHKSIITKELFNKTQDILNGTRSRPKRKKHLFAYKEIFLCEGCNSFITAEIQKGYSYYHCTGGKGSCEHKKHYTREEIIEEKVLEKLKDFKLDEEIIDIMYEASLEKIKKDKIYDFEIKEKLEKELKEIEIKEERLLDIFLSGKIDQKNFDKKSIELKNKKSEIQFSIEKDKNKEDILGTFELAKKYFKSFIYLKKRFLEINSEEKNKILKNILSNSKLKKIGKDTELILQWKKPYNVIIKPPKVLNSTNLLPD